jgi:hypothetical protein
MIKKVSAIIAAAACAGVMVAFVPGFAPETAKGATQAAETSAPAIDPVITAAAEKTAPSAAEIEKAVAQNLRNGSHNPKIICAQSWPNYDQSCLQSGQSPAKPARVVRVIATDRAHAARIGQPRR